MGAKATHLVSVFAHHARLVLGQLAVDDKSNEIPCLRALFKTLPKKLRLLVTAGAMHTQVETAKLICGKLKSHYLMIVKANQPGLLARIQALPWAEVPHNGAGESRGHGRVEHRSLQILTVTKGIGFPYAKQVIRVTRERLVTATSQRSTEVVYAICSLASGQARPATIAQWLQQHWGIENRVHWVRDVTLDEDRSTIRTGAAPQIMASLRNTALNLHRINGAENIAEACRATAFNADRGLHLLTNHQTSRSQAC
jgi:predicted transposase YbfD/YdcC